MATFIITYKILVTNGFSGVNVGDTFTLTVVTDGFSGVCTVANGHLISVTGSLLGSPYTLSDTDQFPDSPTFDGTSHGLDGETPGISGGLLTGLFTYHPMSFTVDDENAGASGSVGLTKRCLQPS